MIKEIKMPNLGTTVDEVKILKWLKKVGDRIERGEAILEVETDKATMEVESYLAGYLKKIAIEPGASTGTGSVVAYVGDESDVYEGPVAEVKIAKLENEAVRSPEAANVSQVKISPMIKKLAEKYSLDIIKIKGTGPEGLILKEDVMLVVASVEAGLESATAPEVKNTAPDIVPFTRNGFAVANAMTKSKSGIPHVYFNIDVDATAMKKLRESSGKKYSYNAILVYNIAKCLKAFPYLMAKYDEKGRILAKVVNIGLAVAKGDELYAPVVKNVNAGEKADHNEIMRIEQELNRLVKLVAEGDLKQEEISGGVFTLTNLGPYGVSSFTAIINPPEVGILAAGAIKDSVVVENGSIVVRPIITFTLSVDHRVVNGSYAAQFLNQLKANLERM
ncbi:MAG: dihydrolipoamide acetyltransferase family protein [Clostridiales bacterium]|nr:dihydrolipoamide acetyltransferase family protein [Clostridiales bacterium]